MAKGMRSGAQLFLNPEPKLSRNSVYVPGIVFLQPSAHSPWEKCVVCRQVLEEVGSGQFAIHRMRDGGEKKKAGGKREYDMERCGRDKAGGEENEGCCSCRRQSNTRTCKGKLVSQLWQAYEIFGTALWWFFWLIVQNCLTDVLTQLLPTAEYEKCHCKQNKQIPGSVVTAASMP